MSVLKIYDGANWIEVAGVGSPGATGAAGTAGSSGTSFGSSGTSGQSGTSGNNGSSGTSGNTGSSGTSGISQTASGSDGWIQFSSASVFGATSKLSWNITSSNLQINGNTNITGTLTITSSGTGERIDISDNTNAILVYGNKGARLNHNIYVDSQGAAAYIMYNPAGVGANLFSGTGNSYFSGSSANFGLGTKTPTSRLDVVGNTRITGSFEVLTSNSTIGIRIKRYPDGVYYSDIIHNDTPQENLLFKVGDGSAQRNVLSLHADGEISASGAITASGFYGTATTASFALGGFKSYATSPADMPPIVTSSWDDEFSLANGSAPDSTKWIWANKLSASAAIQCGKLVLTSQGMGSQKFNLLLQPTGSMASNWTFAAKVSTIGASEDALVAGIVIYSTSSGKFTVWGHVITSPTAVAGLSRHQRSTYPSFTGAGASAYAEPGYGMSPAYFKIYRSGSGTSADTVFFYNSFDGVTWAQAGAGTLVSNSTIGDISHIGICINNQNATYTGSISVDWFRGNWTASWDPTVNY